VSHETAALQADGCGVLRSASSQCFRLRPGRLEGADGPFPIAQCGEDPRPMILVLPAEKRTIDATQRDGNLLSYSS